MGYRDAERDIVSFTTAPSLAVPVALRNAGLNASDIVNHEINEAFSVVALANMKLLNLDPSKVNVFGGAVFLGHPIGMSGGENNLPTLVFIVYIFGNISHIYLCSTSSNLLK